ncbi:13145_t:CDS:10 [Cetraspora pellucida]|uniref:13145_t:CDS:1 n=1 Tax=Cetraspora pellucida TaxID=1433469 RepID=A0A9N8ZU45_9GLOM|nr:13145_t:CDS:10 [Cetraspora pellucida]
MKNTLDKDLESNAIHDLDIDITIQYSELRKFKFLVKGGFGEVYEVQWNGQRVAAKFVIREDPTKSKDFDRELTHLKESKNCAEYIVQFLGLSQDPSTGKYIFVMQFAEDGTLKDYLIKKKDTLDLDTKIYFNIAILNGLRFLHDKNIIHRFGDLQPHDGGFFAKLYFGLREEREIGMPMDYIKIYEKCWIPDPSLRPEISNILNAFKNLKKEPTCTVDDIQSTDDIELTGQLQLNQISTAVLERSIKFDTFLPLFKRIQHFEKIKMPDCDMQLNKRMCKTLNQCIIDAEHNVKTLHNLEEGHDTFATVENYVYFQIFLQNVENIHGFIENISQIRGLQLFIQHTDSEDNTKLNFIDIFNKINANTQNASTNIGGLSLEYNELFDSRTLVFVKKLENENIQKTFDGNIMIIRRISYIEEDIRIRVALLKNLGGFINITKFYGVIKDESSPDSIFIVTEWSEYGNLKALYKNYFLDSSIKLKIALDICSGLVFLNAVNFLHRNIRPENILVTSDFRAKITNFFHSRLITDETRNLDIKITGINYSENYSFGVVLWELSNEETPFDGCDDDSITRSILGNSKHRKQWNFKNSMPNEFIKIVKKALDYTPENRPMICHMFKVLSDLVKNDKQKNSQGCPKHLERKASILDITEGLPMDYD